MIIRDKKILVTGHNGFLGSNLVKELVKLDAKVLTLNDNHGRVDLREWHKIWDLLKKEDVDYIYHLAAETYVPYSYQNPRKVYEVNISGTLNILELARRKGVGRTIYTSSYVYGTPRYLPIDEEHPIEPSNPYSRSKILSEKLLEAYYHDFGLKFVVLRPFNIYGRDQSPKFVIPSIIKQLEKGKIVLKDHRPRRDFIHVQDVVNALVKALESKKDYDTFNIGYGKSYSVQEIADKIINLYGKPVTVHYLEQRRRNEIMDTVADISKAKDVLGWRPNIDIDRGLLDVLEGYIS